MEAISATSVSPHNCEARYTKGVPEGPPAGKAAHLEGERGRAVTKKMGVGKARYLAVGASVLGTLLGGTATAQQPVRVESVVTIRYSGERDAFQGRVSSAEERCVRKRIVLLKKVVKDGPDRVLSRDVTNREGRYRMEGFRNPRGRFYAVARRKEVTPPGVVNPTTICTRSRSNRIRP